MKEIRDNFSDRSADYARYRPHYPAALYEFLLARCTAFDYAWDAGTGNGQVAAVLADRFATVEATDISASQIAEAMARPNVEYSVQRAEQTRFPSGMFNLITVGQALHWFDFDAFNKEALRVAADGCIVAAWTYALMKCDAETDALILDLYRHTTGPYWDPERLHVDMGYHSIPFPFERVDHPAFEIRVRWSLEQLSGYLSSWSGVKKYMAATGKDPIPELTEQLRKAWNGDPEREVVFPLHVLVGRVCK